MVDDWLAMPQGGLSWGCLRHAESGSRGGHVSEMDYIRGERRDTRSMVGKHDGLDGRANYTFYRHDVT